MRDKNNKTGQFTKASELLKSLKPNVTAEDRKKAMQAFDLSDVTIVNYLKGDVRDLSTAEKLIVFFRQCVSRREKVFSGTDIAV
jgi:hypothetical protein